MKLSSTESYKINIEILNIVNKVHNPTKVNGCIKYDQSGTKPNLVAKILATNFGVCFVI